MDAASAQLGATVETGAGPYRLTAVLGKGKSGVSYLAENDQHQRVLKIMHDEPVPFYTFSENKVRLEVTAYEQLCALDLAIPRLFVYDEARNYLLKEYLPGQTAAVIVGAGTMHAGLWTQLFGMARTLAAHQLNIDYFPTNFIVTGDDRLVYLDYEVNPYTEAWNLANWGIFYWVNSAGMRRFLRTGDGRYINQDPAQGIPIKAGLEDTAQQLLARYAQP